MDDDNKFVESMKAFAKNVFSKNGLVYIENNEYCIFMQTTEKIKAINLIDQYISLENTNDGRIFCIRALKEDIEVKGEMLKSFAEQVKEDAAAIDALCIQLLSDIKKEYVLINENQFDDFLENIININTYEGCRITELKSIGNLQSINKFLFLYFIGAIITEYGVTKESTSEGEAQLEEKDVPLSDMMTSELCYHYCMNKNDSNKDEYCRRLESIGVSEDIINKLWEMELTVFNNTIGSLKSRDNLWARRFIFPGDLNVELLEKVYKILSMSEMLLFTDDANAAEIRLEGKCSEDEWNAICMLSTQKDAKYAIRMKEILETAGLNDEQIGTFIRNECLILERLKWGWHEKEAWTLQNI